MQECHRAVTPQAQPFLAHPALYQALLGGRGAQEHPCRLCAPSPWGAGHSCPHFSTRGAAGFLSSLPAEFCDSMECAEVSSGSRRVLPSLLGPCQAQADPAQLSQNRARDSQHLLDALIQTQLPWLSSASQIPAGLSSQRWDSPQLCPLCVLRQAVEGPWAVPVTVTSQAEIHPCGLGQAPFIHRRFGDGGCQPAKPPAAADTDPADSVQSHHLKCHRQGFGSAVSSPRVPRRAGSWSLCRR